MSLPVFTVGADFGGDDDYQQQNQSYDAIPSYKPADYTQAAAPQPVPAPVPPPSYGPNNGYGEPHGVPPPDRNGKRTKINFNEIWI